MRKRVLWTGAVGLPTCAMLLASTFGGVSADPQQTAQQTATLPPGVATAFARAYATQTAQAQQTPTIPPGVATSFAQAYAQRTATAVAQANAQRTATAIAQARATSTPTPNQQLQAGAQASQPDPQTVANWTAAIRDAPRALLEGVTPTNDMADFPGSVLVPSDPQSPFAGMTVTQVGWVPFLFENQHPSYQIALSGGAFGHGLWSGSLSRYAYDVGVSEATTTGCSPTAPVCSARDPSFPGVFQEWFLVPVAGREPVVVTHRVNTTGQFENWWANWYRPDVDGSYGFSINGTVAGIPPLEYNPNRHTAGAQYVATATTSFVERAPSASVQPGASGSPTTTQVAQAGDRCPPGQSPSYTAGFANLSAQVGDAMGQPVTCEFPDPNGTGDVHQKTSAGLASWRKSTNTPTFTDGYNHWALTSAGMVTWTGSSIDPPADFSAFAGIRGGSGLSLEVLPTGAAFLIYRIYSFCGPGVPQPCDSTIGNNIIPGGNLTLQFNSTTDTVARGQVVASTDPTYPVGATAQLTLLGSDAIGLQVGGRPFPRTFCGAGSPPGFCGGMT